MSSLSWFLYFADVLGRFGSALGAVSIISGICVAVLLIIYVITGGYNNVADGDRSWKPETKLAILKLFKSLIGVFVLSTTLYVVAPSSTTMYMIAGVEMGKTVISDPENSEIISRVKKLLENKLSEAEKEQSETSNTPSVIR